ncbi:MAG: DUF3098 domain-containing protein [Bacteroidales bacterium]|nr:DUF3098 domain-containing protein [Bacteroidales bacterium]MBR0313976.1 DUF3098 domain-containing protein [Bacteroidales bacterium]MBR6971968.1 DUF3098 domain-containing protein [Bacteroidales bacterium]
MEENKGFFALPKKNLIWMIVGFLVMVAGYLLLCGGGSQDPSAFSPEIFSFRRLVLAPIVIIAGAVGTTVAIIKIKK